MRVFTLLLLLIPAMCLAETVSIVVTAPTQQLNVVKESTIIAPQSVVENVIIDSAGTEIVTIAVPGPQGIPGSGGGGTGGPVQWTDVLNKPATFAPTEHSQAAGTITGLAGVATSGSYTDLSNKPVLGDATRINTVPVQGVPGGTGDVYVFNADVGNWEIWGGVGTHISQTGNPHSTGASQIAYNATTVAEALDSLLYVPISISSFTLDGGGSITREIGSSYTVGTLAWSTNKTPTSQTINSVARTSPYTVNATVSSNTTYTLYVADGTQSNASSSRSVSFSHYRYWGVSASATLDDAALIALSKEFSVSRAQTRSFTPAGQYIYVAYLATGGDATFTVNGFLDTSWVLVQRDLVNASGYSSMFRIYRSANPLTGTFSVVVS